MTEIKIHSERVDELPLLLHLQSQMGIPAVLNELIAVHGNRTGLTIGSLITCWQAYLIAESDHRMCEVETWAASQLMTLQALLPEDVTVKDFTDDRLADALRLLSDDDDWEEIETRLGQRLLRVYQLPTEVVRLDSTAVAVYHDADGTTLFRHGHSKDHRPDLAQFKVMLATLDPLGMPLATLVVAGNEADDPLYLPALERARAVIGTGGKLYLGDSKMAARQTRAEIAAGQDYYLMPLPQTGTNPAWLRELIAAVVERRQAVETIAPPAAAPEAVERKGEVLALGYEVERKEQATVNGQLLEWQERVLVVYSPQLAAQGRRGLAERLERAEQELRALTPPPGRGKRLWTDQAALEAAVHAVLKRHRVEELLTVRCEPESETREVRGYGQRPARIEERQRWVLRVAREEAAIRQQRLWLGWRLYATNAPRERLSLAAAVWVYRGASRIERNFSRLKGRPLGLRPVWVTREDHAKGLVRLLTLALRLLTLAEFVVREKLGANQTNLAGLYAGNPTRTTARPTTERLLGAFEGITLTVVSLPDQVLTHLTPLTELQRQILCLLRLPAAIYEDLVSAVQPIPP